MMLANWVEDRRSRRREREHSVQADAAAVAEFRARRDRAVRRRSARARRAHPTLAELIDRAIVTDPRLWERRTDHATPSSSRSGSPTSGGRPTSTQRSGSIDPADEIVAEHGPLPSRARRRRPARRARSRHRRRRSRGAGSARAVVLAAATLHGPADVDVVVCAERRPGRRLGVGQVAAPRPAPRRPPAVHVGRRRRGVGRRRSPAAHERPLRPTRPGRVTLVVADGAAWWRDRTAPLRAVLADPTIPVRIVALTDDVHALPAVCTTFVRPRRARAGRLSSGCCNGPGSTGSCPTPSTPTSPWRPHERWRRWTIPRSPPSAAPRLPERVPILDVVGIDEPTAEQVRARWAQRPASPGTRATIGVSARGTFSIDLVADGPHALVAGTTGAGKSELLRSLVVGLAVNLPPDELNVVLVDFKGGSAFDACADLPAHRRPGHRSRRAPRRAGPALPARRARPPRAGPPRGRRRRRSTSTAGSRRATPLPRLLVVVDEFAFLAVEFPEFMPALVDIAQRGRSLGLHLILATQRPAGVVDNKIKANTNLRIALRVQDDGDSMDVVGKRDAAAIPRRIARPGDRPARRR